MSEERDQANEKDMLIRRAVFGKQVDNFLSTDIGRYLMARAKSESDDALADFKRCDPADEKRVRRLQTAIQQADNLKAWLETAVLDGLQAIEIIEEEGGL